MTAANHGSDDSDDGGLLEDVVEDILGENLPPPRAEDPWERRERVLETTTTVILSLAAVATAWATFQASQWASAENDGISASSAARAKAIQATSQAARTEQLAPRSGSSGSPRSERETRRRPSSCATDSGPACCERTTSGSQRRSSHRTGR
jgi:hypothetical protein